MKVEKQLLLLTVCEIPTPDGWATTALWQCNDIAMAADPGTENVNLLLVLFGKR